MKSMSFIIFNNKVIGKMPDDSVEIFPTIKAYEEAYKQAKEKLEDEIADEMFRLENEFEIDDLHLDYLYGGTA